MESQDDFTSNQALDTFATSPRSELLSSKFLRKTKFRRKSIATSPTELSTCAENGKDESMTSPERFEPPSPATTYPKPQQVYSEMVSEDAVSAPRISKVKEELPTPSLTPALETVSAPSPSLSRANSPPLSDPTPAKASSSPQPSSPRMPPKPPSPLPEVPPFPLSPEELDQAKSLVLDLLGWGVDPEYLVTSGLSPVVVFRVFTDLNLRLPTNLELSEETKAVAYPWGPPAYLVESMS